MTPYIGCPCPIATVYVPPTARVRVNIIAHELGMLGNANQVSLVDWVKPLGHQASREVLVMNTRVCSEYQSTASVASVRECAYQVALLVEVLNDISGTAIGPITGIALGFEAVPSLLSP